MKNMHNLNFGPKLFCSIFGHNYFLSKRVTYHVKEFTCKSCQKGVTTDVNGNLIDLTSKFKEINSVLERIHNRKKLRLQEKITFHR